MYVESIVAYQAGSMQTADLTKRRNWIFTHVGLSAHAHTNSIQFIMIFQHNYIGQNK